MKNLPIHLPNLARPTKKTVLLVALVAAVTVVLHVGVSTWLSRIYDIHVPSMATIQAIGVRVYDGDIQTQGEQTFIDWGTIIPGTLANRSFLIQSISNIEIRLNLTVANWNVTGMSSYILLTWNCTNVSIAPGDIVCATLTLEASDDNTFIEYLADSKIREFSFDIIIHPSEEQN